MSSRPSSSSSMVPSTTRSRKPSSTKSIKPSSATASNTLNTRSTGLKSRGSKRSRNSPNKSVSFGVVQVREYERVVGDHPGVSDSGPALSLGWRYEENEVEVSVDSYERIHGSRKSNPIKPLKGTTRRIVLEVYFHVPKSEIYAAQREVAGTKQQRKETLDELRRSKPQRKESTTRRLRRLVRPELAQRRRRC